ncbi:NERD domain-containing protein [Mycolicibacterium rufum]|uniref:NERD domain-containing protein n=1 Tax=Mycolicibacterium rufum TaxID=318424 RepID=A0A9X2YBU9_9MYCO|nr:ATP-binding domain-containing protein [Mycolicibacterium rufum]KGI66858.1 nuclease [Mycolicibacterium rufum]MCV7071047.1 NERD domain-containing protein [Mycolicibacterium rufum]ULP37681.1 NERD domain-containing protein [Mycolicibacterium rufum]
MTITVSETPRLANGAERRVWQALIDQLEPGDLVIPGKRVTDHLKDHEIDFFVAIEGAGIVCIEVKGGEVWHDGETWRIKRRGHVRKIDPVRQAREACYALRDFVEKDPRWTQGRLRWDHVVVLPNTDLPDDFALPDCPRWKVIDRTDLADIVAKLRGVLQAQELDRPLLSRAGIAELNESLSGRGLPQRSVVARALENEDAADVLTEHQSVILDAIRLLRRVEIRGGAGSGKTFLAMEQARRLARDGQRVALVCYSHGLASYLERITATWNRRQQPAYVGEFHDLGKTWGAPAGPDESLRTDQTVQFWERDLPAQMTDLATQLDPGHRFDAIVVDEAQDFADAWWDPLLAALRDDETGGLYVFTDEGQRVFHRHGSPPVPLVPLVLDHNLRNTRQIANAFQPLVDHPMRFLGGEGPAVKYVACSREDAMDAGDDEVDALLEQGWRPEDVALLTTGSRHPEQRERQAAGNAAYWDSFWDAEQVFYGHVLGFKGLERRAVVLVVNEESAFERSRERLYVGLSRARDQLVVCGDPDFLREVGGPDLARRLNIDA